MLIIKHIDCQKSFNWNICWVRGAWFWFSITVWNPSIPRFFLNLKFNFIKIWGICPVSQVTVLSLVVFQVLPVQSAYKDIIRCWSFGGARFDLVQGHSFSWVFKKGIQIWSLSPVNNVEGGYRNSVRLSVRLSVRKISPLTATIFHRALPNF